ncbi:MAG: hypothetical protein HYY35_07370 [Deltaproteobacteria bacterium]|nr:hypothetical protein [Deltaproteobacteria bacterium]
MRSTYDQLGDLKGVLAGIRRLRGVSEPRPGIFYLGQVPFLHFHRKDGARWADVRSGRDWGPPILIPSNIGEGARVELLRTVRRRHGETLTALAARRARRRPGAG